MKVTSTIYYHKAKEKGLCPKCNKPHDGYNILCDKCSERAREVYKNQSKEVKAKNNAYRKRKIDLCKAFGVCIICKNDDATEGMASCAHCRSVQRYRNKQNNKKLMRASA